MKMPSWENESVVQASNNPRSVRRMSSLLMPLFQSRPLPEKLRIVRVLVNFTKQ